MAGKAPLGYLSVPEGTLPALNWNTLGRAERSYQYPVPYSAHSEGVNNTTGRVPPQEGGGCYLYTPSPSLTQFYGSQAN